MPKGQDITDIVLQRYVREILRELNTPKRYGELQSKIKTKRTLSAKLIKLRQYGLIDVKPIQVGNRYVSSYQLTDKGKRLKRLLEKI